MQKPQKLIEEVASYYSNKLAEYGDTPRGVDWNGAEGQFIRFEQLCKVIDSNSPAFSITDLGCGYGVLLEYLSERFKTSSYLGIDVSLEMIEMAKKRYSRFDNVHFEVSSQPNRVSDYAVASGIFNVRINRSDDEWFEYMNEVLDILFSTSRLGFSFNCLTSYSDADKKRDYLYYADPCKLFDLCKKRYSKQVALLHDYGLYEFTILVRKYDE